MCFGLEKNEVSQFGMVVFVVCMEDVVVQQIDIDVECFWMSGCVVCEVVFVVVIDF